LMWKAGMLFFSKCRGEVSSYFVANLLVTVFPKVVRVKRTKRAGSVHPRHSPSVSTVRVPASERPLPQALADEDFQRKTRRVILGIEDAPNCGFTPSSAK
jgi:hypothetical protein